MSILDEIPAKGHEQVVVFQKPEIGLIALIAIHSTRLGPSLGGCRFTEYSSLDEAMFDVLRLAEGMTYKNALCGNNLGGGKSVILKPAQNFNREALFQEFGRCVETLGGRYITAEDMGTSVADMSFVLRTTKFVSGRDPNLAGELKGGGDPSPHTALGVFEGIKAALSEIGAGEIRGKRVAVQGVGHVGQYLVRHLIEAGAEVIISDRSSGPIERARKLGPVTVVRPEEILEVECDVLSPCAGGAVITEKVSDALKCKVLAGAANNQILGDNTERIISDRKIFYAPDFAINAGGVIMCADEFEPGGYSSERVRGRVLNIGETIRMIARRSIKTGELPGEVAIALAQERLNSCDKVNG